MISERDVEWSKVFEKLKHEARIEPTFSCDTIPSKNEVSLERS
jgi:hypothetical protein